MSLVLVLFFWSFILLGSLKSEMERACIPKLLTKQIDGGDNDDVFSEDILRLEESERLLKDDLSRIDVLKYETKWKYQKETIDNNCLQYNERLKIRLYGASKSASYKFISHALSGQEKSHYFPVILVRVHNRWQSKFIS